MAVEELESRCLLTGATTWLPLGPAPELNPNGLNLPAGEATSGRVTSLAFGTYNGQTALYAGTASGGVWRSTDFQTNSPTWTPLTDSGGPISTIDPTTGLGAGAMDVGSLLVQGTNLFVGTGEANNSDSRYGTGILKSIDGGNSWVAEPTAPADRQQFFQHSISKMVADPGTGNLYAAVAPPSLIPTPGDASLGIWQSKDSGSTWSKITGGTSALLDGSVITDLEYTGSGGTFQLYAAVGNVQGSGANGVYTGVPGGGGGLFTWTKVIASNGGRISLASDHAQTVYAAIGSTSTGTPLQSIQGTTNNGTTWNAVTPPAALLTPDGNTYYNLALGFSPASGRLYLGLNNDVYESNKGVTDWRVITKGSNFASGTTPAQPHPDMHAFAFYPGTPGGANSAVYLGTDGGVWRYTPQPFDAADQSSAGNTPVAEVLADFNGDGKPDLAIIDSGTSSLVIRKGNGDGTFGPPTPVFTMPGLSSASLVAADFNQDGQMDLAFVRPDSQVQVMLNNGSTGTNWIFTSQTYNTGQIGIVALAVGHFKDNRPGTGAKDVDLVAVGGVPDTAVVLMNKQDGSGTFTVLPTQTPVDVGPVAVATGDFNGDGKDDVVTVNKSANDITVLLGNGDGTFTGTNYPTGAGTNPAAVAVGDFNNDGKPDVAVANSGSSSVTVFLNDGTGKFPAARAASYTVGLLPSSLAVADFNGDAKLDLAVADAGSNDVTLLTNKADGSGTFTTPGKVYPLGESATTIAAQDLNGDRIPDLVVLSSPGNHVDVLLSNSGTSGTTPGAWDDLNTTLNTLQVDGVSQSAKGRDYLLEGSQDNGVALTTNATGGAAWNAVLSGDGVAARFDPADATGNTAYASQQYGLLKKSGDNG